MKYKHSCIKCRQQYDSDDIDPYYCTSCNEARLEVAKKVDAQMASKPRKETKSTWQILEESGSIPSGQGKGRITCRKINYD